VAPALRLWHLDFGLPSRNDPDETTFVRTALDMLEARSARWPLPPIAHPPCAGTRVPVEVFDRREPPHTSSSPR
jgi:hypothetical protein